ncbi:MAG: serine/threonine protein kinase [Sandaracinaceae bacterium]|nr:serine/threonine protein kinase [Sandaracinaceae bacterium]
MVKRAYEIWAESLLGKVLGERYRLNHVIGRGSFSVVFHATHTWTERAVAVKLLRLDIASSHDAMAKRFLREAKAAAALRHKNVVDVLDMGEAEGTAFIALELLVGEELSVRLAREGRLPLDETLRILLPVFDALHAAHARGMIHRDVKAENVFLHDEEGELVPKILDFGTVRTAYTEGETPLTEAGAILGTPHYMAPEQITTASVTGKADVWSCGVLAFRMLSGRFPFDGPNPTIVLANAFTQPAPSLASVAPELAPGVVEAVDRALAKSPEARHEDMHAFMDALLAGAREVGLHPVDPRKRG